MRAIILAAGRGMRLQQAADQQMPKALLRFDGLTLLERHLRLLRSAGVHEVVLALGWRHELIEAELDRLRWQPRPGSRAETGQSCTHRSRFRSR
jgi:choline kinase